MGISSMLTWNVFKYALADVGYIDEETFFFTTVMVICV
jgi:hypothetical protein